MAHEEHLTAFRALVHGMSWEGRTVVSKYRNGGKGVEEVLTAEVFQALEFLPRRPFVRSIFEKIHTLDEGSSFVPPSEHKTSQFLLSPAGRFVLRPDESTHQTQIDVQFDGMIRTADSNIFVEAKRIGRSSFQKEQPARTYLVALRESAPKRPKVLFVLGSPPPVSVASLGRRGIEDAILATLDDVYAKTQHLDFSLAEAKARISETVGWITWSEIAEAVADANEEFQNPDEYVVDSVNRLTRFVQECIEWHG